MKKYQLSITVRKAADKNSAASKAVTDCTQVFYDFGYQDYNLVFTEGMGSVKYYVTIFVKLFKFYLKLEKNSLVGIQYPMLNNVFKYFVKAAAVKNIKFFCITHDIESLRLGGTDTELVNLEAANLNYYNYLIVHNPIMLKWLKNKGVQSSMYSLTVFDYLSSLPLKPQTAFNNTVVFAGNLAKSLFIYKLQPISNWNFNVYGPNYNTAQPISANVKHCGEYSPEEIVNMLDGDFGLIWDGGSIAEGDAVWGNYLRYNNPHKFSLYLAAGLPVIAPHDSAIAVLIQQENIGVLISSLHDLLNLTITKEAYQIMKDNCLKIREKVIKGYYFSEALKAVEAQLTAKSNPGNGNPTGN
jgi:hypothetical protein